MRVGPVFELRPSDVEGLSSHLAEVDVPLSDAELAPGVAHRGRAVATTTGLVETDTRQVEILAVLAMHPEGMSLSELVEELHGERPVNPVTTKVELSHLRQVLGERLQSRPYRLAGPVAADHVALLAALAAGQVEAAVRAYAAPFLTRSTALGIEDTRRYIDMAVRRAVIGDGEADHLFSLSSAVPDDAYLAECTLGAMAEADPRRALVAARLDELDVRE